YTVMAGLIAGIGLALVYLSLFHLGAHSGQLIPEAQNGAEILHAYVQYTFGNMGSAFLAILIFVACLVTAVGLTCACAEFFAEYLPLSYRTLVFILGLFSMMVSNLGLSHLIQLSIPILTAIYPPCIVLVMLSFTLRWWNNSNYIVAPTMLISLVFGVIDGVKSSAFAYWLPEWANYLPLSKQGLAWLLPSLVVLLVAAAYDQLIARQTVAMRT
ncbi:branched-chain amino acid transport system II carrier protein, partial [Lonsdalea populi]